MNPTYLIMIEDLLQYAKHIDYFNMTTSDFRKFYCSICEAVERQQAHNVLNISTYTIGDSKEEHLCGYCICGEYLYESEKYCSECGTALDWNTERD